MATRTIRHKTPVKMSCGHWQYFSVASSIPIPGDYMFCMQCMRETHCPYPLDLDVDNKPVTDEWRWICVSKNCRMSRRHGQSKQDAIHAASKHVRNSPHHDIHVIRPDGVIELRLGRDANELSLFAKPQTREPIPF